MNIEDLRIKLRVSSGGEIEVVLGVDEEITVGLPGSGYTYTEFREISSDTISISDIRWEMGGDLR